MQSGDHTLLPAIMLAYCRAGLRDYGGSSVLLYESFPDGEWEKAERLHTAFVYLSVGMWADAVEELRNVARQCPDLPEICLLLGDLLMIHGRRTEAINCWRLAIARDRSSGAVAAVARHRISSQMKLPEKA